MTLHGMGKDIWNVPFDDITLMLKYFYVEQYIYQVVIILTKISIALISSDLPQVNLEPLHLHLLGSNSRPNKLRPGLHRLFRLRMQADFAFLDAMGRRAPGHMPSPSDMDLRQQRFQHPLRPHRLLSPRAETHGAASQGQEAQGRCGPHLPPRPLRHNLQYRAPAVLSAAGRSRQRNIPLQRHLAMERSRRRRRGHLRLHADSRRSYSLLL